MIVTEAGQIAITGACGGPKRSTDLEFHKDTLNKMASQIPKPENGKGCRLSIIVNCG